VIDSVVVWKWRNPGYRSKFTAEHVNTMRRMVARHYDRPHRFVCITDDSSGIDSSVEVVPLWDDHAEIPNPTWAHGPSCYRRLRAFAPEFADIAGRRFVSIDLDVVIVGDLVPVWDRPEDFVIYDPEMRGFRYNGSMWLMTAGTRRRVWDRFDPETSPALTRARGLKGSDQAWIHYVLGDGEATWRRRDGVLSYSPHVLRDHGGNLPKSARVVMFHGKPDPWEVSGAPRNRWVRRYYQ
jgi:hypothetical protein